MGESVPADEPPIDDQQALSFLRKKKLDRLQSGVPAEQQPQQTEQQQHQHSGKTRETSLKAGAVDVSPRLEDFDEPELPFASRERVHGPSVDSSPARGREHVSSSGWKWHRHALSEEALDLEDLGEKVNFLVETRRRLAEIRQDETDLEAAVLLMELAVERSEDAGLLNTHQNAEQHDVDQAVATLLAPQNNNAPPNSSTSDGVKAPVNVFHGDQTDSMGTNSREAELARVQVLLDFMKQEDWLSQEEPWKNRSVQWYQYLYDTLVWDGQSERPPNSWDPTRRDFKHIFGNEDAESRSFSDGALADAIRLIEELICAKFDKVEESRRTLVGLSPLAQRSPVVASVLRNHGWTTSEGFSDGICLENLLGDLLRARGPSWKGLSKTSKGSRETEEPWKGVPKNLQDGREIEAQQTRLADAWEGIQLQSEVSDFQRFLTIAQAEGQPTQIAHALTELVAEARSVDRLTSDAMRDLFNHNSSPSVPRFHDHLKQLRENDSRGLSTAVDVAQDVDMRADTSDEGGATRGLQRGDVHAFIGYEAPNNRFQVFDEADVPRGTQRRDVTRGVPTRNVPVFIDDVDLDSRTRDLDRHADASDVNGKPHEVQKRRLGVRARHTKKSATYLVQKRGESARIDDVLIDDAGVNNTSSEGLEFERLQSVRSRVGLHDKTASATESVAAEIQELKDEIRHLESADTLNQLRNMRAQLGLEYLEKSK